jgi:hypothetical protein
MSNDARRIGDLSVANTLSTSDRVVVLINPASTANVLTITVSDFIKSVYGAIPGPYASDVAANAANVAIKSPYYNNDGFVKIRLT